MQWPEATAASALRRTESARRPSKNSLADFRSLVKSMQLAPGRWQRLVACAGHSRPEHSTLSGGVDRGESQRTGRLRFFAWFPCTEYRTPRRRAE